MAYTHGFGKGVHFLYTVLDTISGKMIGDKEPLKYYEGKLPFDKHKIRYPFDNNGVYEGVNEYLSVDNDGRYMVKRIEAAAERRRLLNKPQPELPKCDVEVKKETRTQKNMDKYKNTDFRILTLDEVKTLEQMSELTGVSTYALKNKFIRAGIKEFREKMKKMLDM